MGDILGSWEVLQEEEVVKREERRRARFGVGMNSTVSVKGGKQKAKMQEVEPDVYVGSREEGTAGQRGGTDGEEESGVGEPREELGPLVVFACRHLYHQTCLERTLEEQRESEGGGHGSGFRCPIDG